MSDLAQYMGWILGVVSVSESDFGAHAGSGSDQLAES